MSLSGRAKLAGVMGWPVSHSRSPSLHGYWLERYAIDGAYVPLAVQPTHLEQALRALPALGFCGVNLTVPHKEAALAFMTSVDAEARALGAINTVVVGPEGALVGSNTDVEGFRANVEQTLPDWRLTGPAVLLGAGGAARAVAAALPSMGGRRIRLVNRNAERAHALAEALKPLGIAFDILPWSARAEALDGASLLINTTVLGMAGQAPLDLALDALPRDAVVCDIVYVPLATPLLKAAADRGHRVVDGLGMLLHQARPGFAAWFGQTPEVTADLRAHVLATMGAP